MKKLSFGHTYFSCYIGIFVQAVVCGFMPLLFVMFNREYHIPLYLITLFTTVNFLTQLVTDTVSILFVERIGYRRLGVLAHLLTFVGLFLLGIASPKSDNLYAVIMSAVVLFSVGGGLLEVMLSPVIEGCPSKNKAAAMSMLHSMFGFGSAATILITTGAIWLFGWQNWQNIALFWSVIPLLNAIYFMFIPINDMVGKDERTPIKKLLSDRRFWGFFLIMACGGASEIGISQWSSAFAEKSLGVSKAVGDILGPCAFALMLALSRFSYSKLADKIDLEKCIIACGVFGVLCYSVAALAPFEMVALIACGLCGFFMGVLWPGTLSLAAKAYPMGGATLFALMALGGDVGCTTGPTIVGFVSSIFGGELKAGLLTGALFPLILVVGLLILRRKKA